MTLRTHIRTSGRRSALRAFTWRSLLPLPSPHDEEVGRGPGRGDFKRARQFDETSPSPQPSPRSCLAGGGSRRFQRWCVYQAAPAFTLVELLLVLVILGILAAIVVPKFAGRTEQAKKRAAETQLSAFITALDIIETDNGYYPKSKDGLQDLRAQPHDAQNWHGPYMEKDIPLDPWNHPYIYVCPGKHNPSGYDLYSVGPDGREGNEDDITNWQQKR